MEEREKEIDLKDLCVKLLSKWVWMIIIGLMMAALLGGYKFIKTNDNGQVDLDERYDNLTFDEKENVDAYFSIYKRLDSLRNDMKSRAIYQIDPYHVKKLNLVYEVRLPEIETSGKAAEYIIAEHLNDNTRLNHICAMYGNKISSDDFIKSIMDFTGDISKEDMRSLVSADYSSGLLYINVIITEDMEEEKISDAIKDIMDNYSSELYKTDKHTCALLDEFYTESEDDSMINTQNNLLASEYSLYTQASNYKKGLGENERNYIDTYFAEENAEDSDGENADIVSKLSKKWIILGFIVGVFLVCMWEVFIYVISGKLHTEDDLTLYHGLQLFGTQYVGGKKASKRNGWAYKLFNRGKKVLSPEEQKEIIASGIEIYCKQNDIKDIVITGTDIQGADETYITELMDELKKSGISSKLEKNIYYHPKALQSAVDSEGIILVEKLDYSYDNEIDNVLQKAGEYNINVLGAIALI